MSTPEKQTEAKPQTVDAQIVDSIPTCPTGYYYDPETNSCILDVGSNGE